MRVQTEDVVRDPLPFLVMVGERLAQSLDLDETLHVVLDIVVPTLADMSSIHLLDDDGRFRRIAARHHSAEAAAISAGLTDHYLDSGERDGPIHRLLANAQSILSAPVANADMDLIVGQERRIRLVQRLGLTSTMAVPLAARGRPFGVLCMSTATRPPFEQAHLHLAQEIGRRAAVALDTARVYCAMAQSQRIAERARQRTAFLAEASAALATSLDVETTLQTVVKLAVRDLVDTCSIALVTEDGALRRVAVAHIDPALQWSIDDRSAVVPVDDPTTHPIALVVATGQPHLDNQMTDETLRAFAQGAYLEFLRRLRLRSCTIVPLEARGRRIGALTLARSDPERTFDGDDVALAIELAGRAALALENARLYREVAASEQALQRLVQQLMATQEDERRRLAYEIHDGAAQLATGLHQLLEATAYDHPHGPPSMRGRLELATEFAQRMVVEIRRVLAGLRPTVLDDFGLVRGLRAYVDGLSRESLTVTFEEHLGAERLPAPVEIALFRLAQEALTNVRKHAGVDVARLHVARVGETIVLEVEDGGHGFDRTSVQHCSRPGERLGLLGMRERIGQVNGTLEVVSQPGTGTLVRAIVPAPIARVGDGT